MKRFAIALLTLSVLLMAAPSRAGLSDQKLGKFFAKYATPNFTKPKVACICLDDEGSELRWRLGVIRGWDSTMGGHPSAACYLINIVNEKVSEIICGDKFEVLSK